MQNPATLRSLTDSVPAPISSSRLRDPGATNSDINHKHSLHCHCCGGSDKVTTDQYGETLCADCQERASGDTWFDMGGG